MNPALLISLRTDVQAEEEEGILCFKYFLLCDIYIHVVIKGVLQGPVPFRNTVAGKPQSLIKDRSYV